MLVCRFVAIHRLFYVQGVIIEFEGQSQLNAVVYGYGISTIMICLFTNVSVTTGKGCICCSSVTVISSTCKITREFSSKYRK